MIPLIAAPHVETPPPIQANSFSGVPTQTSATARIPFHAVPSTGNDGGQVYNNTRNGAGFGSQATASVPLASANVLHRFIVPGAASGSGFAFTTQFMAQVIGQNGVANGNGMMESFMQSAQPTSLTPNRELLDRFSLTRYLPSNAAKPIPKPQGVAQIAQPASAPIKQAPAPVVQQTINNLAVNPAQHVLQQASSIIANAASLGTASPPQLTSTQGGGTQPARSSKGGAQAPGANIRLGQSTIRPQGVNAYIATFSRNVEHLDAELPDNPIRMIL